MFLFDLKTIIEIPFQTLIGLSSKFVENERNWRKWSLPKLEYEVVRLNWASRRRKPSASPETKRSSVENKNKRENCIKNIVKLEEPRSRTRKRGRSLPTACRCSSSAVACWKRRSTSSSPFTVAGRWRNTSEGKDAGKREGPRHRAVAPSPSPDSGGQTGRVWVGGKEGAGPFGFEGGGVFLLLIFFLKRKL